MNAIKTIRTRLGLTQAALAEAIGCTQGNVGHYENKGQTVPPDVARRLITYAATLGISLTFDDVYGPVMVMPTDLLTSDRRPELAEQAPERQGA